MASVELDRKLIWQSEAAFTYGADFAMQVSKVEIHFGGLLGYLATMNRGADRIHDKSLSVAVSYDMATSE